MLSADDFRIQTLGPCGVDSPLESAMLLSEENGILVDATLEACRACAGAPPAMESAGPRRRMFFNPKEVRAAIVTLRVWPGGAGHSARVQPESP